MSVRPGQVSRRRWSLRSSSRSAQAASGSQARNPLSAISQRSAGEDPEPTSGRLPATARIPSRRPMPRRMPRENPVYPGLLRGPGWAIALEHHTAWRRRPDGIRRQLRGSGARWPQNPEMLGLDLSAYDFGPMIVRSPFCHDWLPWHSLFLVNRPGRSERRHAICGSRAQAIRGNPSRPHDALPPPESPRAKAACSPDASSSLAPLVVAEHRPEAATPGTAAYE